ncbi:Hypothetical predicted protein [Pelobates cultripes]|uniref:Uncharacterized protein n=1 Tax=Pelobates cultripes TaxID=61616 RepID=A0AAD1T0Y9_PELCU|nr:Hypothetical predicted protein [Pelobates cultripes]
MHGGKQHGKYDVANFPSKVHIVADRAQTPTPHQHILCKFSLLIQTPDRKPSDKLVLNKGSSVKTESSRPLLRSARLKDDLHFTLVSNGGLKANKGRPPSCSYDRALTGGGKVKRKGEEIMKRFSQ